MRLAGTGNAGFFPLPQTVLDLVCEHLETRFKPHILDPCCGEGIALARISEKLNGVSYGIELDRDRAKAARKRCENLIKGDALSYFAGGFSLLYLNPPYDSDGKDRIEVRFLAHYATSLVRDGVLIYVIPEYVLDDARPYLEKHFVRAQIYRFPDKEYEKYKQILIVARRAGAWDKPEPLPRLIEPIFEMQTTYVPYGVDVVLERNGVSDQMMYEEAALSGLWPDLWRKTTPANTEFQPLMKIKPGLLALLIAGGFLNGQVVEGHGKRYLVNGNTMKTSSLEELHGGNKTVEREHFVGTITALDLDAGEVITIQ